MRRGKQTALWVSLGCFIVLIGFTPSSLSAKERYEDKFEQTVDLARDGKVILSNISGDIEVKTWNKNQVKIDALKVSRTDSQEQARENFDHVAIVIEEDGGTLRIEWNAEDHVMMSGPAATSFAGTLDRSVAS